MILQEGLAELRGNLLHDDDRQAVVPQYFWTDPTLVRYIDEAQRRFARRTFCILDDTTSEVTRVTLVNGTAVYTLHEAVLQVKSARHEDSQQDLVRVTHPISYARINPATDPPAFYAGVDAEIDFSTTASAGGRPIAFATDEGTQVDDLHQIRMLVRGTPNAAQAGKKIYLRVIRLPLVRLSAVHLTQRFEIPEDWQIDMLEWAAYRALRNWDGTGEGGGQIEEHAKAERHKARFEEAVKECMREMTNKIDQRPTFRFGGGGFGGYVHN